MVIKKFSYVKVQELVCMQYNISDSQAQLW